MRWGLGGRNFGIPLAGLLALIAIPLAVAGASGPYPRSVVEADGRKVLIPTRPERVVSTTLGSDHILLALAGPERILALTHFAADPAYSFVYEVAGKFLPDHMVINTSGAGERLLTWRADLVVVASFSDASTIAHLRDAGIPVIVLQHFRSLDDVRSNIFLLGEAMGEEDRASALVEEMDRRLGAVAMRVAGLPKVRVMTYALIGGQSVTEGRDTSFEAIIQAAGGENIAATEGGLTGSVSISMERLLALDPDVILVPGTGKESPHLEDLLSRPGARGLKAVRTGQVVVFPSRYFYTVSQYITESIELFARLLHPEAFAQKERL